MGQVVSRTAGMSVLDFLEFYVRHEILPSTAEQRVQLRDSVIEDFLQTGAEATPEALHSFMSNGLGADLYPYEHNSAHMSQLPSQMVNALQHVLNQNRNREFAEDPGQRRHRPRRDRRPR